MTPEDRDKKLQEIKEFHKKFIYPGVTGAYSVWLLSEVERLEKVIDDRTAAWSIENKQVNELFHENRVLEARLERAEEVIRWYGGATALMIGFRGRPPEPKNKELGYFGSGFLEPSETHFMDNGKKAREYLASVEKEK